MAKIKSLAIKKFRGIKELKVDFNSKSWVIHGRNGSGKSGVIDAIEFGLSGFIGRLSGEGRGDVSVKDHGPHVDSKVNPKESIVTLVMELENSQELTIIRNCSQPNKPKLLPEGDEGLKLYEKLYFGKEIVLSRRDILKFVLTEPGKRSKEVQSLLKIEKLEEIRASFQSLYNKVDRNRKASTKSQDANRLRLTTWLKTPELSKESLLKVVNERRTQLKLSPISDFTSDTNVSEGIAATTKTAFFYSKKDLKENIADISKIVKDDDLSINESIVKFSEYTKELEEKKNVSKEIKRLSLLEKGLVIIDDDECPLCEKEWSKEELKLQISERIEELGGIKLTLTNVESEISNLKQVWRGFKEAINAYKAKTEKEDSLKVISFDTLLTEIDVLIKEDTKNISKFSELINFEGVTGLSFEKEKLLAILENAKANIEKLPEKSEDDSSKEFLTICQERLENYQSSKKELGLHEEKLDIITTLLEKYNHITETYLNNLYRDIEKDFSLYYQQVNEDDESAFTGDLTSEKGALDFKVDFYGRGKFPPVAYHSEGHQDGMGLCLYLALMKKILNDDFTIAILDDVLMSVDSSHRKSFCKLLKDQFPNTQFVITTHDSYWQKQMITEGLVTHASSLKFKNWSVDTGPTVWSDQESWEIINRFLDAENVPEASSELRRFLEYYADEVAIRIGAKVLKNASGDHGLGELLDAISSRFINLLKKAKQSAVSWDKNELAQVYEEEKSEFNKVLTSAQRELWSINATVHFNKWAEMDKGDFLKLKEAYQLFVNSFKCTACNTLLHVVPTIGASESLKCDCGTRTYNLKKKK